MQKVDKKLYEEKLVYDIVESMVTEAIERQIEIDDVEIFMQDNFQKTIDNIIK